MKGSALTQFDQYGDDFLEYAFLYCINADGTPLFNAILCNRWSPILLQVFQSSVTNSTTSESYELDLFSESDV